MGTLVSNFVDFNFVLVGNILGYSVLSNLVFFYHFHYGNYCWFTRNAPTGLLCVNLIDITSCFLDYSIYSKIFNVGICAITLILALIFELKRRLKA